eukprot:scaffold511_cov83-Skeletonema_dohrnii-CCMP3373.AAC.4
MSRELTATGAGAGYLRFKIKMAPRREDWTSNEYEISSGEMSIAEQNYGLSYLLRNPYYSDFRTMLGLRTTPGCVAAALVLAVLIV